MGEGGEERGGGAHDQKNFPPSSGNFSSPPLLLLPALLRTADIGGAERRATLIKLLDVLTSSGEERGGEKLFRESRRQSVSAQFPPCPPWGWQGEEGKGGGEREKEGRRS